jgi:hypothetical protein
MNKTKLILEWLQKGRWLSSQVAFSQFGVTRLSSIIFNLRAKGHDIQKEMIQAVDRYGNSVRYANYYLEVDITEDIE